MAFVLHAAGVALAIFWTWRRPSGRLATLLVLWWVGILAVRARALWLGLLLPANVAQEPPLPWTAGVEILQAAGAVLLLRAVLSLTRIERPFGRRQKLWAGLAAVGLLLAGVSSQGGLGPLLLTVPWLLSFRWRRDLGAGAFGLWMLHAVLTPIALVIQVSPGTVESVPAGEPLYPGLARMGSTASIMALMYAVLSVPAVLNRAHLSFRRIGRRLVSSHLLAGLVPVTLAALFLLLSGALFLSTYRSVLGVRILVAASREAGENLAAGLASTGAIDSQPFGAGSSGQIVIARHGDKAASVLAGPVPFSADSLLAVEASSDSVPLAWVGGTLYLRSRLDVPSERGPLRIEALVPVDSLRMVRVSDILGVPVRVNPHSTVVQDEGNISIGGSGPAIGPPPAGAGLPGGAISAYLARTSRGWERGAILASSSARFGESLTALVSIARENPLATVALMALAIIAALFLAAIWLTTVMVTGMGRTITRAVRALTEATAALRQGRLDHRIRIEGNDELWSVAGSFNEMAAGLERMREMELERERLEEELRLARDIQKRLLPTEAPAVAGFDLAGVSLPARHVGGDYFDYIPIEDGRIGLIVADVSGKGVPAALLMSGLRASLRSADMGRLGPSGALEHLNRFVSASVDPGKFVTAFLGILDPARGTLRYSNAGHEPPILLRSDGSSEGLSAGGLILGILREATYEEGMAGMDPESFLVIFTDGVTEAQNPAGEFFGSDRLMQALGGLRGARAASVVEGIVGSVQAFAAEAPQYDDITLIVARRG